MTGKTVCTLLNHSKLEHFENLIHFNLTDLDVVKIREIAQAKNMTVASASQTSYERWFSCDNNGKHAWAWAER